MVDMALMLLLGVLALAPGGLADGPHGHHKCRYEYQTVYETVYHTVYKKACQTHYHQKCHHEYETVHETKYHPKVLTTSLHLTKVMWIYRTSTEAN